MKPNYDRTECISERQKKKNTYRDTDDTYKTVFINCVDSLMFMIT